MAYETDLLEFDDLFDGNPAIERKVAELKREALAELQRIEAMGGAVAAVESSYMKQRLVESNLRRLAAIEAGTQPVIGVNMFADGEPSPLSAGEGGAIETVDPAVEREQVAARQGWKETVDVETARQRTLQMIIDAISADARGSTAPPP